MCPSLCLSHLIYSETLIVLIVSKFDKNVWSVNVFACNEWYDFVLSLGPRTCENE